MNSKDTFCLDTQDLQVGIYEITQYEDQLEYFEQFVKLERPLRGKVRERFLLRKGITSCVLAGRIGKEPEELRFFKGKKGKPFLKDEPVFFNLSHSEKYLAIAISDSYEVGVDIQTNLKDVEHFPSMILSAEEQVLSQSMSTAEKQRFLLRIWTCKEAIVKAAGDGLTVDVSHIDLSTVLWPEEAYEGILLYEGKPLRIKLHSLEFEDYICSYALRYDTIRMPDKV